MECRSAALALLVAVFSAGGCAAAAVGAGAGAAGAVYFTSRGAESKIGSPISDVAPRVREVMTRNDVRLDSESIKHGGEHMVYKGKSGDREVTFTLERKGEHLTDLKVEARKNAVEWDKDFAKKLLNQVVAAT
jgi:hypothetical protein